MLKPVHAESNLFDRELPADWIVERTSLVASEKQTIETGLKSLLIFRVGSEWLGLPTAVFDEVVERCAIHSLPHHRNGVVKGVVSIRGELLLCISLEILLGLSKTGKGAGGHQTRLLVSTWERSRAVFEVDEIHGVFRYHPRDLRPIPETLAKAATGAFSLGALPWKDEIIGCLDEGLVYSAINRRIA